MKYFCDDFFLNSGNEELKVFSCLCLTARKLPLQVLQTFKVKKEICVHRSGTL